MRVLIVGGGSAGWITAATLLARDDPHKSEPLSLTVVESPDTPRIGVGEATIPTFRTMLAEFGLKEAAFFKACDATVKHAIRFDGWRGDTSSYLHPFHHFADPLSRNAASRWLHSDRARPFGELVSAQGTLIRRERAPRPLAGKDYSGMVPYAYHLDAELFAEFLARDCVAKGVVRQICHVEQVERDGATRQVRAVISADGGRFDADFFVDCTGFRQLLADPTDPDNAWLDQSEHLTCDRAVTMRIPRAHESKPSGFTQAKAMTAGWCWDIGLGSRRGRGYVYASDHCTADQAESELRMDEGVGADGIEARHLTFNVGRRRSAWHGNVASIGLSAGFLEPLESTGLYFAQTAARFLAQLLPPRAGLASAPQLVDRFNQRMADLHDTVLDFIALHYALSRRSEPFWRDAAAASRRTDRLNELMSLWKLRPPELVDIAPGFGPFTYQNYEFILLGNDWPLDGGEPGHGRLGPHPLASHLLAALPDLHAFHAALKG